MQLTPWSSSAPSEAAGRFLALVVGGPAEVPVTDPGFGAALDELGNTVDPGNDADTDTNDADTDTMELAARAYWARSAALSNSAADTDECLRCYVRALVLFREIAIDRPGDVPPPVMQGLRSNDLWFSPEWWHALDASAAQLMQQQGKDPWFVSLAIALTREAIRLEPVPDDSSPDSSEFERRVWTHMLNLATMYCQRALLTKSGTDADQAVDLSRQCVGHEPVLSDRSQLEFNLSCAHRARFLAAGQQADRDEWIKYAQAAVDHVAWDDPRRAARLSNLREARGDQS